MSWPPQSAPPPEPRRRSSARPWIVLACVMGALALVMGAVSAVVLLGRYLPGAPLAGDPARQSAPSVDWAAQPHPSLRCGPDTPPEVVRTDHGDVTGDGYPEALVTVNCRAVTSHHPDVIEVYDGAGSAANPRLLSTFFDSDDIEVSEVDVAGSVVSVEGDAWSADAANCCPDQTFTQQYAWTGTGFTASPRTVTPVASTVSAEPAPQVEVESEPSYSGCPTSAPALYAGYQTSESLVLLCGDSSGQVYYYGTDLGSGSSIVLPASSTSRGYEASNEGYTYVVTGSTLVVEQGGAVVSEQPILTSW